ncbi:unnamed protein product [Toxocara canis]|uniref:DUF148 domain-containing protein n=1 Tax=Toxocara canis TaxID=6265 RepID=A0A183UUG2_TOXCA|nr:unnamed protein product [Toxocara canis]
MGTVRSSSILFTAIVLLHYAAPLPDPPHHHRPFPKDLPPGFAEVLPPDVVTELRAIHRDDSLSPKQKFEKISKIMDSLPDDVRNRLPPPPFFKKLPANVQAQIKAIHQQKGLTWDQRHEKIHAIIAALPEEQKRLLRPPPPPPE